MDREDCLARGKNDSNLQGKDLEEKLERIFEFNCISFVSCFLLTVSLLTW